MMDNYLISQDGSSKKTPSINAPSDDYTKYSVYAVFSDALHIFGGASDPRKIAKLEDCVFSELPIRTSFNVSYGGAALAIDDNGALLFYVYN